MITYFNKLFALSAITISQDRKNNGKVCIGFNLTRGESQTAQSHIFSHTIVRKKRLNDKKITLSAA